MAECSLFSYGRMQSVQTVTFVWRNLMISRSENTTYCTEHSPWEAKSHLVSQEISSLSWNTKILYHIFVHYLLIKRYFRGLLCTPVNNITHAQHFPLLTLNTTSQQNIKNTKIITAVRVKNFYFLYSVPLHSVKLMKAVLSLAVHFNTDWEH
jgi:hypothetical protein